MMMTVNTGQVAWRDGCEAAQVQAQVIQNVRNLYRTRPHAFMGIWRREGAYADHFHLLTHAPRYMRATLMERLPEWLSDPINPHETSKRFDRSTWQVVSMARTWHLCRVYTVQDALDYIAKVPLDANGAPLSPVARRMALPKSAREFGIIGIDR